MATWSYISAADFVKAWQTSDNLHEVAEKLTVIANEVGIPAKEVDMQLTRLSARANYYRSKGVPLKKFKKFRSTVEWDTLKKLASELTQE